MKPEGWKITNAKSQLENMEAGEYLFLAIRPEPRIVKLLLELLNSGQCTAPLAVHDQLKAVGTHQVFWPNNTRVNAWRFNPTYTFDVTAFVKNIWPLIEGGAIMPAEKPRPPVRPSIQKRGKNKRPPR